MRITPNPGGNIRRRLARLFVELILVGITHLLVYSESGAQQVTRLDNRGKDFRVAFLPTDGGGPFGNPTLTLIVWADKPTSGTITYLYSNTTTRFSIPGPNLPVRINLDSSQLILQAGIIEERSNRSVLVHALDEITLFGLNTQWFSSDSFLGLPDDVLGDHYIVLAYPSTTADGTARSDEPSQFGIVAREDNTVISIRPTARVNTRLDTNQFYVQLNAGEVFLGQATGDTGSDLTGTDIQSNKAVAVYGSHQRTNIPFSEMSSRDHLVEQLPPVNLWASSAILTPHFQMPKNVPDSNIFRVIAAQNGTVISVDSVPIAILNAADVLELPLDRAKLLTATGPILVAQYQSTTTTFTGGPAPLPADSIGDPFMMLALAPEQFDSTYAFESFRSDDFTDHFVNVVIPTDRVSSLRIDHASVKALFGKVPKTGYSFAQIRVSPGFHYASAGARFGLYTYGYGIYNSYGAPGGIVFDTSFNPSGAPLISVSDSCSELSGMTFKFRHDGAGLEGVRLLPDSKNVEILTEGFIEGADTIRFHLHLRDPYQDGSATIMAVDTSGLESRTTVRIKGFTVGADNAGTSPVELDTLASKEGRDTCTTIVLHNYGSFAQNVQGISAPFTSDLSITGAFPLILQPGDSAPARICFHHTGDTSFSVPIVIDLGCLKRTVAILPLEGGSICPLLSSVMVFVRDDSATVGEVDTVSLQADFSSALAVLKSTPLRFRCRIVYDGRILYCPAGRRSPEDLLDSVSIAGTVSNDSIIARIPFIAMLGGSDSSLVRIIDFAWLFGDSSPTFCAVSTQDGVFHLGQVCRASGSRLIDPDGQAGILKITPNPANESAEITFETIELGHTSVTVMSLLGTLSQTAFGGELPPGTHTASVDTRSLGAGAYYIVLTTPTVRRVQRIDIVK